MDKKRIVVASDNEHKIKELKDILKDFPFDIFTMKEVGLDIDIEESGSTFLENAYIKAKTVFDLLEDTIVLADDSGLSVDCLDGAPGVYSARFSGVHGNTKKNNEKLLSLMEGKINEDRKGRFVCAIVLIIDKEMVIKVQGEVEGYITIQLSGDEGFGYDPLFYVPAFNKTFAQMSSKEKNSISHRGRALEKLRYKLESFTFGD
ncbi:MAG TPA: XTP/dITP diphosphatase [Clostridiaceae bacterium]